MFFGKEDPLGGPRGSYLESLPDLTDVILSRPGPSIPFLTVLHFSNKQTLCKDRQTWVDQFNSEWISPNSLIAHAFQACEILGIELVQPFHIVAWRAHPVSFLDFAKRDIKAVLVAACRHSVYHSATRSARKDLSASRNILDFPGTCCGNSKCADSRHESHKKL